MSKPIHPARRAAITTLGVLGVITVAAVAYQIALAAFGAFGGGFVRHETFGYIIGALTLLVLLVALVARPSTAGVVLAVVLFALAGPVQPLLASLGHANPLLGALHGLDAAVIFAIAGALTSVTFRARSAAPVRGTQSDGARRQPA